MSRSLVTIAAALAIGASLATAVEFSFLLGLATLSAATLFDLAKDGQTLLDDYGWRTPLLGAIVAFVTAVIAVRWLVSCCGHIRCRSSVGTGSASPSSSGCSFSPGQSRRAHWGGPAKGVLHK